MKNLKLVPHVENETSDNVILSEEIKSSSSNNVYTVTIYQNQISCTCPAGGSKTLCKHMIEVIKKHSEELKQQTPEFLSEITNLIDAKTNKTKTKEEIKELSAKLIFVNRAISEKAHDNARFTKHHQYEEKDQRHIDTELVINEIEKTDIYSQFEFFDLLSRIYSDSNLGFRYVVEPEKLKPFIKLGYLIQVEQGDNKDFYRMCRGREKCKYYYRFSEQIQDLRRLCKTWKVPKGKNWSETKIQKELNKVATLFEDECKNGLVVDNRQNFAQYAEYVIDLKERTGIKHKTISLYKNLLQRINFAIGHIKLTDLRPQHLNLFYEELSKDGVNISTGGKLSAKTIREYHNLISTILDQAEKELLIPYNPATKATPPKLQRKEIKALEIEEIKRIFDILKDEPIKWRVAIHLLAASGCRRGELLGLKWGNIDFNRKQIFINNNILYSPDRGIYEDTPKTESSIRYISLPDETLRMLKKYKIYYQNFKNSLGSKWSGSEYVLTQEYGQPMHPDSVTGYCKKLEQKYNNLAQKHGWEPIKLTPHIFRHSQASILIYLKMDIVLVSKRLGHAQVSTTSDIYSHILKEADAQAAAKLSSIF